MRSRRITEMNPIQGPELKELLMQFWARAEKAGIPQATVGGVSAYPTLTVNDVTLYTAPWEEIRENGNECNGAVFFFLDRDGGFVSDFYPDLQISRQARTLFFPLLSRQFGDDFRENIDQLGLEPEAPAPTR